MSKSGWFLLILIAVSIAVWIAVAIIRYRKNAEVLKNGTEEERNALLAKRAEKYKQNLDLTLGPVRSEVICPHCQVKGKVRYKDVKNKKGISGGKATGAVLTGGVSMLATGLSRKEAATRAYCQNCQSKWDF